MPRFITLIILSLLLSAPQATALQPAGADYAAASDSVVQAGAPGQPRKGLAKIVHNVIEYFNNTNKPRPRKAFDISFIGGPHYSSDAGFGVGVVASGIYYNDTTDTVTPPSNVSLKFDATTNMYFTLSADGMNVFSRDRYRINYNVSFSSIATKFWGIGYNNNVDDNNESRYKYLQSVAKLDFMWQALPRLFVGPMLSFDYTHGRGFRKPWLWEGQPARTFSFGVGASVQYDTRDNVTGPTRGVNLRIDQRFMPRKLLNKFGFSLTEVTAAIYRPVWRGGVVGVQLHGRFTYGNVPWTMLSTFGGSQNMRGYYEGRYRDKCETDAVVELRQHVWRRNSLVVWGGAGAVYPSFKGFHGRYILPNYGIGYRWEFKQHVNVRLDLGFGRNACGFIFSINEAF